MFSSSAWIDSALVPVTSVSRPDPGCAVDDAVLTRPLDTLSSSSRFAPADSRPLRWLKELLYRERGAGLGDAELEDDIACSDAIAVGLRAEAAEDGGGMKRASADVPVGMRAEALRGEADRGESPTAGEAERGGALKGWNDTDGRRWTPKLPDSPAIWAARPEGTTFAGGKSFLSLSFGDGEPAPESLRARSAEIGLAPVAAPTWWNVERLPYARVRSGFSTALRSTGTDPISGFKRLISSEGKEGRKISSSAPMKRELNKASESSTRKSQFVLYVTWTVNGPAGDSVTPKLYVSTTFSLPSLRGAVK